MRHEHVILVIQIQMHAGIVHQCGLMDIDIQAVVRLHLQGGLHTCRGKRGLGRVRSDGRRHQPADFRKPGLRIVILLRIVVPRNPERLVVPSHGELREFLLDYEIGQAPLLRKLIPEAQPVIIQTEPDEHHASRAGLLQGHGHFIVMVPDMVLLAPDRSPGLVERTAPDVLHLEAVI